MATSVISGFDTCHLMVFVCPAGWKHTLFLPGPGLQIDAMQDEHTCYAEIVVLLVILPWGERYYLIRGPWRTSTPNIMHGAAPDH